MWHLTPPFQKILKKIRSGFWLYNGESPNFFYFISGRIWHGSSIFSWSWNLIFWSFICMMWKPHQALLQTNLTIYILYTWCFQHHAQFIRDFSNELMVLVLWVQSKERAISLRWGEKKKTYARPILFPHRDGIFLTCFIKMLIVLLFIYSNPTLSSGEKHND